MYRSHGYTPTLAAVVVVTVIIGELPLPLWLLIKGVNVERWHQRSAPNLPLTTLRAVSAAEGKSAA